MKPKTYCEKWPVGCQTCELTLCDGKNNIPAVKLYGPGDLAAEAEEGE